MTAATGACLPITLRPYQQAAVQAVYDHLRQRDDIHHWGGGRYHPSRYSTLPKPANEKEQNT